MKRKLFILSVAAVLLVGWFLYQLFGPLSKVELGRETTYITEPLAEDGLPNYALAILQKQREGVTPENNGALPFWRAMGPSEMTPSEFELLCEELGLTDVDLSKCLIPLQGDQNIDAVASWVEEQRQAEPNDDSTFDSQEAAEDILVQSLSRPWKRDDYPPLAKWAEENEEALDWLVEASAKPKFFSPSVAVLVNPESEVIMMSLQDAQVCRVAMRALCARAMMRSEEGQLKLAWSDLLAALRLGDHVAEKGTLVEKLVGIAVRGVTLNSLHSLLDQESLSKEQAERILDELNSLNERVDMYDALEHAERYMFLDAALRMTTGRLGGFDDFTEIDVLSMRGAVNPNVILKMGNQWYDRMANAGEPLDREERQQQLDGIMMDMLSIDAPSRWRRLGAFVSKQARSRMIGDVILALMLPAISSAYEAEDRVNAQFEMARIAAALAIYHAQQGRYPENLETLTPAILKQVPSDLYSGRPFVYQRRGEGYLLYSFGRNEADDQGTHTAYSRREEPWLLLQGEWMSREDYQQMLDESYEEGEPFDENQGDDLVIRLPLPK